MTWQPELMFAEPETNRRPTQAGRILDHLRAGNRLTALEALDAFGCFRLAARIHELRLSGAIILLPGFRNDDPQLVDALHACDVFVLPSRHEPFGIVVLEAWCAGKAVIASRVGGLRSLITDGEDGLLVPPDSPMDLAAQLRALKNNAYLRQQLGSAGRHTARSRYDWSQIGAQLEEIYQQAEQHAASTFHSTAR